MEQNNNIYNILDHNVEEIIIIYDLCRSTDHNRNNLDSSLHRVMNTR